MKRGRAFVVASLFCACGSFEEAGPPTAASDAGTDADAGASAVDGSPADAPTIPFCAVDGGTLCEDFDDPRSGTFPTESRTDGGTLEIISSQHVSSPNALRVTVPTTSLPNCPHAYRNITGITKHAPVGFTAEYKFRLAALGGPADLGSSVILVDTTGQETCSYFVEVAPGGMSLAVLLVTNGAEQSFPLGRKALAEDWTSIVVDVHGVPGSRKVSVTASGVPTSVTDTPVPAFCQHGTILVGATVGVTCLVQGATAPVDVAIDDVRVIAR